MADGLLAMTSAHLPEGGPPPKLLDRVRSAVRLRHYSRRTEKAYVDWIRRYILFHQKKHPSTMGAPELVAFLSWLAVDKQVSASTQNQHRARWIAGRASFLFPVRALSIVFRAKYLAGLHRAFDAGELTFASGTADLADRGAFTRFLGQLRAVDWIVYAKRPFAGPEQVLDYLGRYTHRVALSNDRLVAHRDGHVRFRWKNYADHDRVKIMTLEANEFLRRFLLHVVPRGFMRIRHFGLLANRTRRVALTRCRGLLGQPPIDDVAPESVVGLMYRVTGVDLSRCPVCGEGRMQITAIVVRGPRPLDTS